MENLLYFDIHCCHSECHWATAASQQQLRNFQDFKGYSGQLFSVCLIVWVINALVETGKDNNKRVEEDFFPYLLSNMLLIVLLPQGAFLISYQSATFIISILSCLRQQILESSKFADAH